MTNAFIAQWNLPHGDQVILGVFSTGDKAIAALKEYLSWNPQLSKETGDHTMFFGDAQISDYNVDLRLVEKNTFIRYLSEKSTLPYDDYLNSLEWN